METNKQSKQPAAARSALTKPISLRLTQEEHLQLQADAGEASISQHIRKMLFNSSNELINATLSLSEQRLSPQSRQRVLAQILVLLGQLKAANEVSETLEAIRIGLIEPTPEFLSSINALNAELQSLRFELLKALGLRPSKSTDK